MTGTVIEVVKKATPILDIEDVRGFLPASLVEMRRVRDLRTPYLGKQVSRRRSSRTATMWCFRAARDLEQTQSRCVHLPPADPRQGPGAPGVAGFPPG